jgi:hypothetical protein
MKWGRKLKKELLGNDFPSEFVELSEIAADSSQWRYLCGSKEPSAIKCSAAFS